MVGMTWATFPLNLVERATLFPKLPQQAPQTLPAILKIWIPPQIKSAAPLQPLPEGKTD